MISATPSRSQEIRSKLGHPIIDSDGHTLEIGPILLDFVEKIGGGDIKKRYEEAFRQAWNLRWFTMSAEQRRNEFATAPAWWVMPTENSLDRATASLPRLLNERMDELGLDYAVLYPTRSLVLDRIPDPEVRQVGSRAVNAYHAELYGGYSKRMTTAAVIPMHTPEVAIEELEYAVNELGMKVAMIEGRSLRPLAKAAEAPAHLSYVNSRMDLIGMDSDYDYDPFWVKCLELNVAPASHAANLGLGHSVHVQLHVQPHGHLRPGPRARRQGAVHGRRHQAVPRPEHRLPGGGRRVGVPSICGHGGTLGKAQRRRHYEARPPAPGC